MQVRRAKAETLVHSFATPLEQLLTQSSQVAQYSATGPLVASGAVGVGQATALMHSAGGISADTNRAINQYAEAQSKAEALAKAWDLCTIPPVIDPDVGLVPTGRARGHIQFENVHFKYPDRDVTVLKGASFEVHPGQTLGMTGSAGCGKSTALRLLERFYDVSEGRITIDGVDIRDYSPDWLRAQIATVSQEPKLLPVTIRENITFGCPPGREPTLEEIHNACRAANIYDSLMDKDKFPEGLRTKMDAVGNVSGGEKQRIAIARAILADPPILLLDEATSALDEENQEKVQAALNKLMKGRTTLIIAHRLSTIRSSDAIVAFDAGKVVEQGTHDQLLATSGSIYAKLWNKQAGTRDSAAADEVPPAAPALERTSTSDADVHGEQHVDQHGLPLTLATRLGRVQRELSESSADAAGLERVRAELLAISEVLRRDTRKLEREHVAATMQHGSAALFGWKVAISGARAQRSRGFANLHRLGHKVMLENKESHTLLEDVAPPPLMRAKSSSATVVEPRTPRPTVDLYLKMDRYLSEQ